MNNTVDINGTYTYVTEMSLIDCVPAWSRHCLTTFIAIAFLLGIPGNCLVVKVHCHLRTRSVTDWMVFYLAVSDLCSLSTCAPSFILTNVGVWSMFMPSWMCKFHYTMLNTSNLSSYVLIAFTALVRMRKTMGKSDMFTSKQACYFGIGIILLCLGVAASAFKLNGNNVEGHCYYIPQTRQLQMYFYKIFFVIALVSSGITCVSYAKIVHFLKTTRRIRPEELNAVTTFHRSDIRSLRINKIMGVVSCVFVCSAVIPSTTGAILMRLNLRRSNVTNTIVFLLSRVYFINNCANPMLYAYMSSTFRRKIFPVLTWPGVNTIIRLRNLTSKPPSVNGQ